VPTVLIENVPKVEKKKQPSNTKLRQAETVTVTQTNQHVNAAQNFDSNLKEITSVKMLKSSCYRPGVAQRVGRGIALLFHDRGTRRW